MSTTKQLTKRDVHRAWLGDNDVPFILRVNGVEIPAWRPILCVDGKVSIRTGDDLETFKRFPLSACRIRKGTIS